jgi:hypothetical protein
MEAAGLSLAVVSALTELFGQCLAVYKLFVAGRDLEKASTLLCVRLAIEEQRLAQWGEGSGFSGPSNGVGADQRLIRNKVLYDVILRTLMCIKEILDDVESLTKKYELRVVETGGREIGGSLELSEGAASTEDQSVAIRRKNIKKLDHGKKSNFQFLAVSVSSSRQRRV